MKLRLSKHGGFAAGIKRPPIQIDSSELSNESAAELSSLIAAAKSNHPDQSSDPGRARDAMSYTITLDEPGHQTTELRASDVSMSESFAALLVWLERVAMEHGNGD